MLTFKSTNDSKHRAINQLINTTVIAEAQIETHFTSITNAVVKALLQFEEPKHINRVYFLLLKIKGSGLGGSFRGLCSVSGIHANHQYENYRRGD